ncbi:Glycosyltransferase involved in cell wall bisynthesis [Arenibacter palladensis]|uniref:Glycosyltransferase involved in cell wall bisynthesis n=2 Tax=Arenibacter palladensis TaxID=237373 RepID=A0A1M5HN85_9FLAO|nr:Glycosyltransferase involved in cell wall bisynthesis [Arenibacter palladensis]
MLKRGHDVEIWGPKLYLSNHNLPDGLKKWLRYIDQFVIFPLWFKIKSKDLPSSTLYVLIDQALGIWMPLLKNKRHVVHCHDFIALKSALDRINENPTSWTGKIYQKLILKGFSKSNCFISISKNTQEELIQFLNKKPALHAQVYNAIDPLFIPGSSDVARNAIGKYLELDVKNGYILHVGGNTFYKNRVGVVELYNSWRNMTKSKLPLLMVGSAPDANLIEHFEASPFQKDIYFLVKVDDMLLLKAYQGASVFVFPSLTEGFGFPIAEAMAVGCPVMTTDEAPMNEVGGTAAVYIRSCQNKEGVGAWAKESAKVLEKVLQLTEEERANMVLKGLANAQRFGEDRISDEVERIYKKIVANEVH